MKAVATTCLNPFISGEADAHHRSGPGPESALHCGQRGQVILGGSDTLQEGGVWHEAMVLVCLSLAEPIGLLPLYREGGGEGWLPFLQVVGASPGTRGIAQEAGNH